MRLKVRLKDFLFMVQLICIPAIISAQPTTADLQKQVNELRSKLKSLEKENASLMAQNRSDDSLRYCTLRNEIYDAFSNLPQLDFDFKNTSDQIEVTGLFTKLLQANNPTSDILGFRFTDIVFSACEQHFLYALKSEHDRRRFSQVISKIIDNPVISTLANTNPITSVVAAIISTVAGFTTSRVEIDKEGGKVQDVKVSQVDAFDQRNMAAFRNDLQVYIDFYDALIMASSAYLSGLEELGSKYEFLVSSVNNFKSDLYQTIEIQGNNHILTLSKILPDPTNNEIDYSRIFNDPGIQRCLHLARKFPALQQSVSDFKKDYQSLITKYLESYAGILKTALDFPDTDIDKSKTGELLADIREYIDKKIDKTNMD